MRHVPCAADSHAGFQGTILALFTFRVDPRTGGHDLHRADPVFGRGAGCHDDLRAAPAADALPHGLPQMAAQPGRIAAGRGGAVFPGANQPDRLDGRQPGAGHRPRARVGRRAAQAHRCADPRQDGIQPLAGEEHHVARGAPPAGAVGAGQHHGFRHQHHRAAVRALFHAHRRPLAWKATAAILPLDRPGRGQQRHARGAHDRPFNAMGVPCWPSCRASWRSWATWSSTPRARCSGAC